MGGLTTRPRARDEELDVVSNYPYKYPPKTGSYFANYFIMGGERFDSSQPENYLFGENSDLNFLGSHPMLFPYAAPQLNEPTRPLKCLINVRKESLRLVRADENDSSFNIEFSFDTDVRCCIVLHYFCSEDITQTGVTYVPRSDVASSEAYYYKRGAGQQFIQPSHTFDPTIYSEEQLNYDVEKELIPLVIQCTAIEGAEETRQSFVTLAVIDHNPDGTYSLRALKQKVFIDGLCYLLQEIYGIENKQNEIAKVVSEDEIEDRGLECVICISEIRDTLILPCRHLCLCQTCAESLRYQANNCPICRAPFRALLQIRSLQRSLMTPHSTIEGSVDGYPGFEYVSLIEALNGPSIPRRVSSVMPPTLETLIETPEAESPNHITVNKGNEDKLTKSSKKKHFEIPNLPGLETHTDFQARTLPRAAQSGMEIINRKLSIRQQQLREKLSFRTKDSHRRVNSESHNIVEGTQDEDSEAEKRSPLLQTTQKASVVKSELPTQSATQVDESSPIDEPVKQSTPYVENSGSSEDYFTPDNSCASTFNSAANDKDIGSIPGTPASISSLRSSGESYSSAGSTRPLLFLPQEKRPQA